MSNTYILKHCMLSSPATRQRGSWNSRLDSRLIQRFIPLAEEDSCYSALFVLDALER